MIDEETLKRWETCDDSDIPALDLIAEVRRLRAELKTAQREETTEERYQRTAAERRASCPVSEAKLFEAFVRIAMSHYMNFQPEAAGDSAFHFATRAMSGFFTGRTYFDPKAGAQVVTIAEVKP